MQATLNCSKATAVRKVQTARMLTAMPVTAAANRVGRLGPDQLRLLADLHANRRCRDQLPDSDALLSGYAATLSYPDFVQVCQRWQAHADPDGWHRDHDTSVDNRQVRVSRIGHGHILQAHGDALTGEVIAKILDDYTHAEFQADVADHRLSARTGRQRRYDALVRIFANANNNTGTSGGGKRDEPLVNIVCTETAAINAVRDVFDPRLPWSETTRGAPVEAHDVVVAMVTGRIRRIVVDSIGRTIDLGRTQRLFTGAAHQAVTVLSGGICNHPGCGSRLDLQTDHLSAWLARHGPTCPANGATTCGYHNRRKHSDNITVTRDQTGYHHWRDDGTEMCPRDGPD